MRHPLPKVALWLLVGGLAFAETPVSRIMGNLRIIPVKTAEGFEGAYTISKLDGSRTGYYYDLGERAGELRPNAKRVVLLGLGGGEMLRAARRTLPNADLLGVDNDPRMVKSAKEEFRIGDFGARAELADAFAYVKKLRGVDVLMVDVFIADKLPAAMLMPQFWVDCRQALARGGLLMVNVYPASMVPKVEALWPATGLKVLEQKNVQGSTVVFGSL